METFQDDPLKRNIEIGCGCGNFGQMNFAPCFLTERDRTLKNRCNVAHIDWFCDAHDLPWRDARFRHVVICNPYEYGFMLSDASDALFREIVRVLQNRGYVAIVTHSSNPYANRDLLERRLPRFRELVTASIRIRSYSLPRDPFQNFFFRGMDMKRTRPDTYICLQIDR